METALYNICSRISKSVDTKGAFHRIRFKPTQGSALIMGGSIHSLYQVAIMTMLEERRLTVGLPNGDIRAYELGKDVHNE